MVQLYQLHIRQLGKIQCYGTLPIANMYTGQYKLTIGLYDGSLFAITQDAQNPQNPETYHVKISNLYVGTSTSVPFIHTKTIF